MADISAYEPFFRAAGEEWDVDPMLLKALVLHESGGNPRAVGNAGEQGLGQIMPGTQRHLGMTDPFDPEQSIFAVAKYLNEAMTAEGDNPYAVLRYYNGGPGWRNSKIADPRYPFYVGGEYQKLLKASKAAAPPAPGTGPNAPVNFPPTGPVAPMPPLSSQER
jgi:soluble lytic murein transglycosylase-like protein